MFNSSQLELLRGPLTSLYANIITFGLKAVRLLQMGTLSKYFFEALLVMASKEMTL